MKTVIDLKNDTKDYGQDRGIQIKPANALIIWERHRLEEVFEHRFSS